MAHECKYRRNSQCDDIEYRRIRTGESISAFRNDIIKRNWNEVSEEADVNKE